MRQLICEMAYCMLGVLGLLCFRMCDAVAQGQEDATKTHRLFLDSAVSFVNLDNERALRYIGEAERVGAGITDTCEWFKMQRIKGQILATMGKTEMVYTLLQPLAGKPYCVSAQKEHLAVLNLLGITHLLRSEFDRSLYRLFQALQLAETLLDTGYLITVSGNIGVAYYKLTDYEKAIRFMLRRRALEGMRGVTDASNLLNASLSYLHLGDLDNGNRYLQEAAGLLVAQRDTTANIHFRYAEGLLAFKRGDYPSATLAFRASLLLARREKDRRMTLDNLYMLSEVAVAADSLKVAHQHLKDAEAFAGNNVPFNLEVLKVYRGLARTYERLARWREAAYYQRRYIDLRDSLYSEARIASLMNVEADFVAEQSRRQIDMQAELLASKEESLRWQRVSNRILAALALFTAAFLIMVYRDLRRSRRVKHLLEHRVRARTAELQAQRTRMERRTQEEAERIARLLDEIRHASRRMEGLCDVATREPGADSKVYLSKIMEQSARIAGFLSRSTGREGPRSASGARSPGESL